RATGRVLEENGCGVVEVRAQGCCGALHAHAGRLDEARELARANIDAFAAAGVDHVVANAAGCGAAMREYGELLADDPAYAERARQFPASVRDVSELLSELGPVPGGPLPLRVTYDAPCHLHHAQHVTTAPLQLLDAIPGLERVPLPGADECCGGAGIYGVMHPELGGRILQDKLAAIRSTGASVVVTGNPGCAMQIGAGLRRAGDSTPLLHPIELLAESYRRRTGSARANAEEGRPRACAGRKAAWKRRSGRTRWVDRRPRRPGSWSGCGRWWSRSPHPAMWRGSRRWRSRWRPCWRPQGWRSTASRRPGTGSTSARAWRARSRSSNRSWSSRTSIPCTRSARWSASRSGWSGTGPRARGSTTDRKSVV